jgi:polysaccharide export outer membrane protein
MKLLRGTLFSSIAFLALVVTGLAQQPAGKPVLSAKPVPTQPAPAPTPVQGTPMISPDYVIGADDVLVVTVWNEGQLSGSMPVRPDGMITLPLVGDVLAAGSTPTQLKADLTTRLKKFVTDPVVDVSVAAVNSKRVYFVGEVGHVGPLQLTPGMTILQAIATAGGLTPYANKKKIYILRGEQGKQQTIHFNYDKALKKDDMQGVSLVPGDTIVVP